MLTIAAAPVASACHAWGLAHSTQVANYEVIVVVGDFHSVDCDAQRQHILIIVGNHNHVHCSASGGLA